MKLFKFFNKKNTEKYVDKAVNPMTDEEAKSLESQFTKMAIQSLKFNAMVMEYLDSLNEMLNSRSKIDISKFEEKKNDSNLEKPVDTSKDEETASNDESDTSFTATISKEEEQNLLTEESKNDKDKDISTEIEKNEEVPKSNETETKVDIAKKVMEVLKTEDQLVWPTFEDNYNERLTKLEAIINNKTTASQKDRAKALKMKFDMLKTKNS